MSALCRYTCNQWGYQIAYSAVAYRAAAIDELGNGSFGQNVVDEEGWWVPLVSQENARRVCSREQGIDKV